MPLYPFVMRGVIKLGNKWLNLFTNKYFSLRVMLSNSMVNKFSEQSTESKTATDHSDRIKKIMEFIPKLTTTLHKGQCGRIGIIGGSSEYTGAPYFAAISSLKLGADLVYVFCCREAAATIKSYSPELIVHPILDRIDAVKRIEPWLGRLHVLVIGPGMGRDPGLLKNVGDIITFCKENMKPCMPLVIDADGLFLIKENLNLIKNYKGPLILTPNVVEFNRLINKMSESDSLKMAATLNAVVVQKGIKDVIINGMYNNEHKLPSELMMLTCDVPGSCRRCGGQGDILSGCLATFVAWLEIHFKYNTDFDFSNPQMKDSKIQQLDLFLNTLMKYSLAAYGACTITRTCSRLAFEQNGRAMTASDMIGLIRKAFQAHFEQ